jgi:hypothetical protein
LRRIGAASGGLGKRRDILVFAAPQNWEHSHHHTRCSRILIFLYPAYCTSTEKYPLIPSLTGHAPVQAGEWQMMNTAWILDPAPRTAMRLCDLPMRCRRFAANPAPLAHP